MKKNSNQKVQNKQIVHFFIKLIMVVLLVCYLGSLYMSDSAKNVPMDQISSAFEQMESVTNLELCGRIDLKRFYQLEESVAEGYFFYKAPSPMAVEEILIVKTNRGQRDLTLECAQKHLENQKNIFEGYGTDQMALLNEAIVGSKGSYVYYMCGSDALVWQDTLMNLI